MSDSSKHPTETPISFEERGSFDRVHLTVSSHPSAQPSGTQQQTQPDRLPIIILLTLATSFFCLGVFVIPAMNNLRIARLEAETARQQATLDAAKGVLCR